MGITWVTDEQFDSLLKNMEAAQERLAVIFPHVCNDLLMLTGKPVRLHWDPTTQTAHTDCVANVNITPVFFLRDDLVNVGFGTAYHEAGHIRFSPYGGKLLERAYKRGGEMLKHVINLIVDRKDDMLNAEHAPGFADVLRRRMMYIATMSRTEMVKRQYPNIPEQDIPGLLHNLRPRDRWEDFFFACKWHKSPREARTARCMKLIKREKLLRASEDTLLDIGERIVKMLGPMDTPAKQQGERRLIYLCVLTNGIEAGMQLTGRDGEQIDAIMAQVAAGHIAVVRNHQMKKLARMLRSLNMVHPGPISTGTTSNVKVKKRESSDAHKAAYEKHKKRIKHLIADMVRKLRRLDNPSEYIIHSQEEGDLDLTETARIAMGFDGIYQEVVEERNIDAEIHLALDISSSMGGEKLDIAKDIGTLFSEGLVVHRGAIDGYMWAFNSAGVYDCGPVSQNNAFVSMEASGGNGDTHMVAVVGDRLLKSQRKRKVLIVICDDGPDNVENVKRLTQALRARGVLTIHMLVGVHATPDIYPVELLFASMSELLKLFGDTLLGIIKGLR